MFCSTIIPTVGRNTLSRAVLSVLEQEFEHDNNEIIVVNDSGNPLPDEDWQMSSKVQIIHTNRHNRSVARNAGAAVSKGKYLHFLDDDDWMVPGAFRKFWELAENSQAGWIHGGFKMVDNAGDTVAEIYPDETGNCLMQVIAWEWLPLQASLILSKAFFEVGGFASLYSLAGGFEDVDLSRQIARYYDMARIPEVVTNIRVGDMSSTTNYKDMFRQNRHSREKTLSYPGVFPRMRASATGNSEKPDYWYGKIIYYYLASVKWHLRQRHILTALSRGLYTLSGLFSAGPRILSSEFWQGVMKPHFPRMGVVLQETGADKLYANSRLEQKM